MSTAKTSKSTRPKSLPGKIQNKTSASALNLPQSSLSGLRKEIQKHLDEFPHKDPKQLAHKSSKSKTDPQKTSASTSSDQHSRGTKRDRSGNVKPLNSSDKVARVHGEEDVDTGNGDSEALEKEVRALGGTDEDLDLIADVNSESEVEGTAVVLDKKKSSNGTDGIQKGITNILKEIALAQGLNGDEQSTPSSEGDMEEEVEPTLDQPSKNASTTVDKRSGKKGKSTLLIEPRPDWFNITLPKSKQKDNSRYSVSPQTLAAIKSHAVALLQAENHSFKASQQSTSSQAFYNTVVSSGTLSDKISALTLAVQESPIHNLQALETLITLASKRARSQAIDSLRALKDLLAQGSLLPSDRKLSYLTGQSELLSALGQVKGWSAGDKLPGGLTDVMLIIWAYEDWLKGQYFNILKMLETWCNDEIEFAKSRAVAYVYELLKERPEQEANLLRLLINKLGDPIKKISSQTSYLLMQLLATHPAMKMTVISAIETDFIFRPGQSVHGKYYAVVTLNQTILSSKEEEVSVKLLEIYFGLFTALLKPGEDQDEEPLQNHEVEKPHPKRGGSKKTISQPGNAQTDELREKLTSAILTGVNRAYPYIGPEHQGFSKHIDTLFRVVHSSNFNTSMQALLLIQQLSSSHQPSSDRFYRILYESLLDPRLVVASKQQLYLNLMHRALKADLNVKRVKAFVKRLLQVLVLHEPPFICGVFFLLQDLEKRLPSLAGLIDHAEDHEDSEEVFRDVPENDDGPTGKTDNNTNGDQRTTSGSYDAHKRAPEHAGAENSCTWELIPSLAHYHPSVSVSAEKLLQHSRLPGKPDLNLHTLIHFLDRFVYRNPKVKNEGLKGSSIMQPMASDDSHAVLIGAGSAYQRRLPVNSAEFLAKSGDDVAAQDVFFHKYFTSLGKDGGKKTTKQLKRKDVDSDVESGDEDEVWKAMMDSAPDLEGDDVSDDDIGLSDLESQMDGDSDIDQESENGVDVEAGIFDDSDDELPDADVELEGDSGFEEEDDEDMDEPDMAEDAPVTISKTSVKKQHASRDQRKKLKGLPTFASVADYAKMLEDDENEDLA